MNNEVGQIGVVVIHKGGNTLEMQRSFHDV